ncbi:MAG: glycoside hydrolase family 3 N-terminal domain-containing protein, partial [candidate division FCPU426 bacterium]
MKKIALLALLLALPPALRPAAAEDNETKIEKLLKSMTYKEKASLTAGLDGMSTRPLKRVGVPPLLMSDGPNGVRWGKTTAFPTGIVLASSFDTALAHEMGAALSKELKGRGRQILLGPCININRHPFGGRNFESYGEDPYLTSRLAVAWIQGLQENGVGASVKHFAANNQETLRTSVNAVVDERVMREIYLPAFEAAVKEGGALTVMAAYNKLNGPYCSANPWLLNQVLKKEWGFQGLVVSDWGATHAGAAALQAGLDLEMPGPGEFMGERLADVKLNEGQVTEAARRILRVLYKVGAFDKEPKEDESAVNTPAVQAVARKVAEGGTVLLKNQGGALPLEPGRVKKIAIIGPSAAIARSGGGGSSEINPPFAISPLQGMQERFKGSAEILYAQGSTLGDDLQAVPPKYLKDLHADYFDNVDLKGSPKFSRSEKILSHDWGQGSPAPGIAANNFSVRWKGTLVAPGTGVYRLGLRGDDGFRLKIDGKLFVEDWGNHAAETRALPLAMVKGQRYAFEVEFYESAGDASISFGWLVQNKLLEGAVAAAKAADAAVIFTGLSNQFESEGSDRIDFKLPEGQEEMILAVAKANPRTIVVILAGSPVSL